MQQCWRICSIQDSLPKVKNAEDMSSTDKLINMFKEKGYDYIILYNNQNKFSKGVSLANKNFLSSQGIFDTDIIELPLQEKQDAK